MRPMIRFLFGVLAASVLMPLSAQAAGGTALVIAESTYAGVPALPDCRRAADLLTARLRHLSFAVEAVEDVPSVDARVAVTRFANDVTALPDQPSFVYVCAAAATDGQRLFLLPSDIDLRGAYDPETQGIVVPALLNALRGSHGTLVAEFAMQSGAHGQPTRNALRARLPSGLYLALTMSDAPHAGSVGRVLADSATPLTSGWDALVPALRAHAANSAITLYAPSPSSPPVPIAAPVPGPTSVAVAVATPLAASAAPVPSRPPPTPPPASVATTTVQPAPAAPPPTMLAQTVPETVPEPAPETVPAPAPAPETVPAPAPAPAPVKHRPSPPAAPRSNRRLLRLQSALRDQGLYRGPVNGVMNTQTVMAIRAFQISIGKPSSGTLNGPEIVQLLNSR